MPEIPGKKYAKIVVEQDALFDEWNVILDVEVKE
jgi:hypothetical protein